MASWQEEPSRMEWGLGSMVVLTARDAKRGACLPLFVGHLHESVERT